MAVVGQVVNGTPDGTVPADLPVTLHVFSGVEKTGTYTTTLAADGSFHFEGVTLQEGEAAVARVVYQGVIYVSNLVTFEPGQQELSLPVTIYETTEDTADVLVTQLHIFMTRAGERLQVGEYYLVSNTGERTYVGVEDPETGQRATLNFALPEGAEGLRFDGPGLGERYLEQEGGFADTDPVQPGTATVQVLFSYELPYREGLQVERVLDLPVASVVLVLTEGGGALEGEGLTPAGTLDTQMGPALSYTAGPLAAGEALAFTLVGQPHAVAPSAPAGLAPVRNTAREAGIGLLALAGALVAVYLLWRSPAPGPLPPRARPLVESIAALDEDFEAGRVSERIYRQKRRSLKQRLRVILREAGKQGSGGAERRGR
nr:hypothetical protein [Anaerolineae bacterium]